MKVTVETATLADKPVLRRLLQLYLYDFTEFAPADLDHHGEYPYRYLDHYWAPDANEERHPFLIRADGELAGFALVRHSDGRAWQMAEFFVLRMYRRHGVGRQAALILFRTLTGDWQVAERRANAPGQAFWRHTIAEATNGNYREESDEEAVVQHFSMQAPVPP
ncbi:MAG: GNAT family N-acetyltransferase [Dehalococcoidia bacterium]|nr:GNAT family N-acetyltransferase [Dehalococcoidia bacterium]